VEVGLVDHQRRGSLTMTRCESCISSLEKE
jgi:hypothetical protein